MKHLSRLGWQWCMWITEGVWISRHGKRHGQVHRIPWFPGPALFRPHGTIPKPEYGPVSLVLDRPPSGRTFGLRLPMVSSAVCTVALSACAQAGARGMASRGLGTRRCRVACEPTAPRARGGTSAPVAAVFARASAGRAPGAVAERTPGPSAFSQSRRMAGGAGVSLADAARPASGDACPDQLLLVAPDRLNIYQSPGSWYMS
jgi:hypothetical protein